MKKFYSSLKTVFQVYASLTKIRIVIFVLLTAMAGYLISFNEKISISFNLFFLFLLGVYFISSGSFILNQAQEIDTDRKMLRTRNRPIVKGFISRGHAYFIGIFACLSGAFLLLVLKPLTAFIGIITIILYNGLYTMLWKPRWKHAAVLGAIPGALPPVIGYSFGSSEIFSSKCIYLFLLLFLWQMPHFWSLAIRYKEDYKNGNIPTLPVILGSKQTIYEIGLYTIAYIGVALISPLFLRVGVFYLLLLIPMSLKLGFEFFKYSKNERSWIPFFLWLNLSILVYVFTPFFDQSIFLFVGNFL